MMTHPHTKKPYDAVIVGGGVFGLTTAYALQQAGLNVRVLEKRTCGWGASGGVLGALMPHVPDQWNPKKQFQFEALSSLPEYIQELEAESGVRTGYRQCGRVIPLMNENDLHHACQRELASHQNWGAAYRFKVHPGGEFVGWLHTQHAPCGYVLDTLAATIDPAAYIGALCTAVGAENIDEGEAFAAYDAAKGIVTTASGAIYVTDSVLFCAGFETFGLLNAYYAVQTGTGVKGQASLLKLRSPLAEPLPPVLYADGIYVIAKTPEVCAVGSTSEREWQPFPPNQPTFEVPVYLEKAKNLCPALAGATLIRHWAGVRPRAPRRDPMVGRVTGVPSLYVVTGGFKIGLGIAHKIAQSVADALTLKTDTFNVPDSFALEAHIG